MKGTFADTYTSIPAHRYPESIRTHRYLSIDIDILKLRDLRSQREATILFINRLALNVGLSIGAPLPLLDMESVTRKLGSSQ